VIAGVAGLGGRDPPEPGHPDRPADLRGGDAELVGQVRDGDDDATAEPDALDLARPDELVGGGAGDAEDGGRLVDGERERLDRGGGPKDRHGY